MAGRGEWRRTGFFDPSSSVRERSVFFICPAETNARLERSWRRLPEGAQTKVSCPRAMLLASERAAGRWWMSFFGEQDWWREDKQRETVGGKVWAGRGGSQRLRDAATASLALVSAAPTCLLEVKRASSAVSFLLPPPRRLSLMLKEALEVLERSA